MTFPQIIQGGMGVGVSGWQLAGAVARRGQIGVVSGTAIDAVATRRLQDGDRGGHMRRALGAFPDQTIARRIIDRYFIDGGKPADQPYKAKPVVGEKHSADLEALLIAANFAEVFLAKEGHDGMVGINYLHKIQAPLLPSLFGAMLAGVDVVIVGAGIPLDIGPIIDGLCRGERVSQTLHVTGAKDAAGHRVSFDPRKVLGDRGVWPKRPRFFPIVSSATLATMLARKCKGNIDGLILEEPSAGGHNAPPRGKTALNIRGEPVYGPRDEIDLEAIRKLGLPFWLAGSYGSPQRIADALAAGAAGVQIGTLFAFCDESGLREDLKHEVVMQCRNGTAEVFKDPVASPTGFPFQVLSIPGTLSEPDIYADRCRQCDLGYLREAYERPDGTIGWRCSAEDPQDYVRKGGSLERTVGRKCLCNGLLANIGLAQTTRDGSAELPLVTCGEDLAGIVWIVGSDRAAYSANEVIDYLMSRVSVPHDARE